jgi:hypothetical protein
VAVFRLFLNFTLQTISTPLVVMAVVVGVGGAAVVVVVGMGGVVVFVGMG